MTANPSNKSIRLTIPDKNKSAHPANLEALERWANNQVVNQIVAGTGVTITSQTVSNSPGSIGTGVVTINASGSSGGYASLTGPGETSPTGALVQGGDLTVDGTLTVDGNFVMTTAGSTFTVSGMDTITIVSDNGLELENSTANGIVIQDTSSSGISIQETHVSAGISIQAGSGGTITLASSVLQLNNTDVGFFAATPVAQQTVTGSRGGNVALASLLTALANLGLIIDSSTP